MKQLELKATRRDVVGKKVRALRRSGSIPAHLFGHDIESVNLQLNESDLLKVLGKAGRSHLISLSIEGDAEPHTVLVKDFQRDYLGDSVIHVDFYQVNLAEKIKVAVPLVISGEAPAVKAKLGTIMQNLRSVNVQCLPGEIPSFIRVDISPLVKLNDAVYVRDLKVKEGIELLNDAGELIIKVGEVKAAKEEVKPVEAVAEVAAEAAAEGEEAKAEGPEKKPKAEAGAKKEGESAS